MDDIDIFIHSFPIDEERVRKAGAFTTLPVRISKYNEVADAAAFKVLEDWTTLGNDSTISPSIGPLGNVFAFGCTEALPERLGIFTYLGDLGVLYDDFCEPLAGQDGIREWQVFERCWTVHPQHQQSTQGTTRETNLHKLVSQALLEVIHLDRESGIRMIDEYRGWIAAVGRVPNIKTYEEYLAHRMGDFGIRAWWSMVAFAIGFKLSDRDGELVREIFDTINECFILSQDYWSWDKEYRAWKDQDVRLLNAIDVLCRTEGLSIELAREEVKKRILRLEGEYLRKKDTFYREYPAESVHLKRWIELLGVCVGSYNYWATSAPRYHSLEAKKPRGKAISEPSVTNESEEVGPNSWNWNQKAPSDLLWRKPDSMALTAPCQYIGTLPSKGVRSMLIQALNDWLHAPKSSITLISNIVKLLHDASLIIDDIQDHSPVRRGKPAAHVIFGPPQVMNSGLFMFAQAAQESRKLQSPRATDIVLENLEYAFLGQSWDLYWRHNLVCPCEQEYLNMVDNKTGGLFRMLLRLLEAESPASHSVIDLEPLIVLLGRFFQIRDDYMNLQSPEYSEQKGFCEDLDEGKYSYPIVHLLGHKPEYHGHITGIFRRPGGVVGQAAGLSREAKMHVLELLRQWGSLEATLTFLKETESRIDEEITRLEAATGESNPMLRLVVARLSVKTCCLL